MLSEVRAFDGSNTAGTFPTIATRAYQLSYQASSATGRDVLTGITVKGTAAATLPPTVFTYTQQPTIGLSSAGAGFSIGYQPSLATCRQWFGVPTGAPDYPCTAADHAAFIDLDGDGRPDAVYTENGAI